VRPPARRFGAEEEAPGESSGLFRARQAGVAAIAAPGAYVSGMRRIQSLYLSGPEPSFPEPTAHDAARRALCEQAGFVPITPFGAPLAEQEKSEAMARELYAGRVALMRQADAAIVNLTPLHGPACDAGAAFEAGFMSGLGKPVFAFMNVAQEEDAELAARIEGWAMIEIDEDGVLRDEQGCEIEDFGLPESLMLWAEARRLYVIVTPEPLKDLTGLELCLEAVRTFND
jgi:nucleoside 2-deoxyribosyltransferase